MNLLAAEVLVPSFQCPSLESLYQAFCQARTLHKLMSTTFMHILYNIRLMYTNFRASAM